MARDELPEGWSAMSLSQVVEIDTRPVLPTEHPDKLFKYVALENVESGTGRLVACEPTRGATIKSNKFLFDHRHVLFGKLRPYLNKVLIPGYEGICSTDILPLLPDPSRMTREWLALCLRSSDFIEYARAKMEGTKMPRLRMPDIQSYELPIPPVDEQRRIVAQVNEQTARAQQIKELQFDLEMGLNETLLGIYAKITKGADYRCMSEVAPLVRRPVKVEPSRQYPELGIRSFGKGTFQKPSINGLELGSKRIFRIEEGDLLFNIVFAWEGAVAVAKHEDHGRFGSHRFLTCVPEEGMAISAFLCFHFLTKRGLHDLGDASPGGAGRNRTLGLKALEKIQVPVPPFQKQLWFSSLWMKMNSVRQLKAPIDAELASFTPALLAKAFRGEL